MEKRCRKKRANRSSVYNCIKMVSVFRSLMRFNASFDKNIVIFLLQARFIAQIIIVGAQVVGRAFTQALRQEFQSK